MTSFLAIFPGFFNNSLEVPEAQDLLNSRFSVRRSKEMKLERFKKATFFSAKTAIFASVLLSTFGTSLTSYAEDARTLPKGRSRFGVDYGQTAGIDQTFDQDGKRVSITAPYNLDLNAQTLQSVSSDMKDLVNLLNSTGLHYNAANRGNADHGISYDASQPLIGDALSKGFLGVDAQASRAQYSFSIQHGVTDELSVGMMIPYIKQSVTVGASITGTNTVGDILAGMQGNGMTGPAYQKMTSGLSALNSANTQTLQQMLQSKGYDGFNNYSGSGLGDIILGGRYKYLDTKYDELVSSAQLGVTIPSGRLHPASSITQIDYGNGAWDLGAANIFNYTPWKLLTLSTGQHYTYQFSSSRPMAVRTDASDVIPDASNAQKVNIHLGDKYWTNLGAKLNISKAVSFESSYEWYWKREDKYSGGLPVDYTYLSQGTNLYTETLQIGLNVSTIPAFMKFDFPVPMDFSINYYLPTAGINSIIAPYGTASLALYF